MNVATPLLVESEDGRMRLVRGCPCYMEFGKECVCTNGDTIRPVRSIEVDPSLVINSYSLRDILEEDEGNRETCYLLIHLEKSENTVHCVSQSSIITINNTPVKATDIEQGLEFLARTEPTEDGILCSSCLYKYLKTTSSNFSSIISDEEKTEALCGYVKRFSTMMASGGTSINSFPEKPSTDQIEQRIKTLRTEKREISARALSTDQEDLVLGALSNVVRLESVFYYHVLELWQRSNHDDMMDGLCVLNSITESLMSTADEVYRKFSETVQNNSDKSVDRLLSLKMTEAQRNAQQLRGLSSMLSRAGFSAASKRPIMQSKRGL
ncbi:hypothetical protein EU538_05775 [Candidatus Thorarchaeota archaeon]|nr:MAG: hypothetical protein EU538_05775 [Candidatus Thorarchaeota archaeon]